MFGYCIKEGYLCLITEYVRGGDLSNVIRDSSMESLSMRLKVTVSLNIAGGMTYLHGKGILFFR
jgi:serine/threonine protein kinase